MTKKNEDTTDPFRKAFGQLSADNDPKGDGWNEPSADLWRQIDSRLDQFRQKHRRSWKWLLLGLLILCGLLAFMLWPPKTRSAPAISKYFTITITLPSNIHTAQDQAGITDTSLCSTLHLFRCPANGKDS